jgi:hypothetical protein
MLLVIIPSAAPFLKRRYWLDLTARDVLWNTSDTGWAKTAWSSVYGAWIQGSCVFVHRMPRFDTSTVLEVSRPLPWSAGQMDAQLGAGGGRRGFEDGFNYSICDLVFF